MTSNHREYVRHIRTNQLSARIAFCEDDQLWYVEAFVRTRGGVRYLETEYQGDQPELDRLIRAAYHSGHFSPRPCALDLHFDPAMMYGVLAQLHRWCQVHSHNLRALIDDAYASEPLRADEDWDAILSHAEWEGIGYPAPNDRYQTRRLLLALRSVGYNEIAEALVHAIRQRP